MSAKIRYVEGNRGVSLDEYRGEGYGRQEKRGWKCNFQGEMEKSIAILRNILHTKSVKRQKQLRAKTRSKRYVK